MTSIDGISKRDILIDRTLIYQKKEERQRELIRVNFPYPFHRVLEYPVLYKFGAAIAANAQSDETNGRR